MAIAGVLTYLCAPYLILLFLQLAFGASTKWHLTGVIWASLSAVVVQILVSDFLSLRAMSAGKKEWRMARSSGVVHTVAFAAIVIGWAVILFPLAGLVLAFVSPSFHLFYFL